MKRMGEVRQLPPPPSQPAAASPPLRRGQNACYEALSLALKEGHVFAALTGPEGSGKTTVLEAVLADRRDRALRCIRISDADKVPASLAEQIEQVAYAEAGKPENLERHVVLAVDDAHKSSPELLLCLSRLAAMREPGRRVPQILLVGRPELWHRLDHAEYEPLTRRLAIRAALPAVEDDDEDPWAHVENEVTQTMNQLRMEAERGAPAVREPSETDFDYTAHFAPEYGFASAPASSQSNSSLFDEANVPPPSTFALFPDPPPAARRSKRDSRRLLMPLLSLFVGVAAFAFALSFYDWPDLLSDMPWSDPQPSTPFVMPRSPQAPSFGLPMLPAPAPSTPKPVATLTQPSPPPAPPIVQVTPPAPVAPRALAPPVVTEAPTRPEPPVQAAPAPAEPAPPAVTQAPAATQAPVPAEIATAPVTPPPMAATPPPVPANTATQNVTTAAVVAPSASGPSVVSAAPARAPAAEPPLSPALVALLLRRGDEQNALGDISAARLLYERAAESGSGLAARQLARTYDSAFLPPAVEGALASLVKARTWYQRAAALGNTEAATRLKALSQGR